MRGSLSLTVRLDVDNYLKSHRRTLVVDQSNEMARDDKPTELVPLRLSTTFSGGSADSLTCMVTVILIW
jgi:hypothetical protein